MAGTASLNRHRIRMRMIVGGAIVVASLAALWVTSRLMGWLNFYIAASGSMDPQLPPGERFFTSNLRTPARGDAVCFRYYDSTMASEETFVFRLYGLPADTVEFRRGTLLINGRPPAPARYFKYLYSIPTARLSIVRSRYKLDAGSEMYAEGVFSFAHLQPHQADDSDVSAQRLLLSPGDSDGYIATTWRHDWNADHFGPVVVPPHHWFLVGDNRRNALDSRYIGFIPQTAYIATVLRDPVR